MVPPKKNAPSAAAMIQRKTPATNRPTASANAVRRNPRRTFGGEATHPASYALEEDEPHFFRITRLVLLCRGL